MSQFRKPARITWRSNRKALNPFAHIVTKSPDLPRQDRPSDTRGQFERWMGDPPPGRSALDQRGGRA